MTRAAAAVAAGCLVLAGCTAQRPPVPKPPGVPAFTEAAFAAKPLASYRIPTPPAGKPAPVTVIGKPGQYVIRDGDTLMDVARLYDLGFNEIVEANPGVDPWVPPTGAVIVLPTVWVLPCCTYQGMVVNIPEMRLYYYEPAPGDPKTTIVHTYPVGLGRDEHRTPRGPFRVVGKTVNPVWNIPPRIREEHIRERGDRRAAIPGGHPDNPLGKYRLDLDISPYAIHGTNIPWGIGMQVSNGCVRLYPEDMKHFFPLVKKGTAGLLVYQPVKVGTRDDAAWVEAHRDIYKLGSQLPPRAVAALRTRGVRSDDARVRRALQERRGLPVALSKGRG